MSRSVWWPLGVSAALLFGAVSGCELILPFDEGKLTGGGGSGGSGGSAVTTAGGTTSSSTSGGATGGVVDGCMADKDCPAPMDDCKVAKCDTATGMCSDVNAPDGTDAKLQTPGDCMKSVCMGGALFDVGDPTDVLDDANPCTDESCDASNKPVSAPSAAGTGCNVGSGKLCDGAGACVECLMDGDCADPAMPFCNQAHECSVIECKNGVKDGDETGVDCGGSICGPCGDGLACNQGTDCQSQICTGMLCQVPTCNDGVKNGNETDVDCSATCGANQLCGANKGCDLNADCKGNQCTGMAGACVPNCNDGEKSGAETDVDCGGGTCNKCAVGNACGNSDNNCVDTAYCDAGNTCAAKKNPGAGCLGANECTSGFCADAVCCNTTCTGTCQGCTAAIKGQGTDGTCGPIKVLTDPANECAGTDVCNGSGACGSPIGAACMASGTCVSGKCVDGVCCNSFCDGKCQACVQAKSGSPNGICQVILPLTDPDSECPLTSCNGFGNCIIPSGSLCNPYDSAICYGGPGLGDLPINCPANGICP